MGQETDKLIDKRFNYRVSGWLLAIVCVVGMAFALYLVLQPLLSPVRRRSFEPTQVNDFSLFSVPFIQNGAPAPMLFVWCAAFALIGIAGAVRISKARSITRELEATEAEVSRRVLVEESLRDRDRTRKR